MASRSNAVFIDIEEDEREYEEEHRRVVDLTQEDSADERPVSFQHGRQSHARRFPKTQRNPPLQGHRSVLSYNVGGTTYRAGNFFELAQPIGEVWKAQFIEIKQIWVSISSNEVLLRGLPYARNSSLYGRFQLDINEVCQIIEVDKDDDRPDEQQAMIEIRPEETLAIRDFHKTNADFHSERNCRYGNDPFWRMLDMEQEQKKKYKQQFAPLTCRWKMRCQYRNASFRRAARAPDTTVYHLLANDINDPAYRISDEQRRREWLRRQPTPTGQHRSPYNFFDAFCGAGGASSGALQGGLKPTIAVDSWFTACDSYQRNFPDAILFRQDISDFIARTELNGFPSVDVLHISPPCQYYSGAKVNEGKNDEKNEVALWACGDLIKKIRPRIFTMEQTFGLCSERFTLHFNKLIQCFTQYDYSVQWIERVELIQYGLPQNRKRLIIMGAAPGEGLPPWPAPTHGNGRKPWVTESMAIGRLPRNVTLHDVHTARQILGVVRNPNVPLPRTIVCSGAQGLIHYDGERDYTPREFATLQGFRLGHEFVGSRTEIKKQIGNAFPASVAKVFFLSIRKFLERQDRNRMSAAPPDGPDSPVQSHTRVDRRQPRHHGQGPRYSRLNGDLDEDEALQAAMRESRRERGRHQQQPREVITIADSDEDELPSGMDRLSVQSMSGSQRRPPPSPLSTASSFTLGNSPSPSPSPRPSTSRSRSPSPNPNSTHELNSSKRKSSDTLKPTPNKRTRDVINVDGEDHPHDHDHEEVSYEAKIAERVRAAAREETASLPPHEDEGRPFTIRHRKWMGKLPMTRDRANGWEF